MAACTKHAQEHWSDNDYRACVFFGPGPDYFVKYNNKKALWPEIATQLYISNYAESQADAPRIAKVIHHFEGDQGTAYLVMEYIKLADSPPDLHERTAEALKWLLGVPAPPNHVIGPLGGGRIRHRFFKDYKAPLLFSSIEALERYIEKGRTRLPRSVKPVRISGERLIFTQPDIDASNFGVDEDGNTVLLDFGDIALLPVSFAMYTTSSDKGFTAVAESLGWSGSSNLASMAVISHCLWITGDPKLGLNEDGYPKTKDSKK
ncbi:unnamed protein product [Cyclocybe aegerita]|uniref:Aminoglycoside phosphotransferase domain-containing protein n=1 Tax=Cyclocybe aegerita TaxID=1973307 RepID=A0A8S0VZ96_CYCAE|nr:unnamed protein product [Cyclocybe aegerita]